MFPKNSPTFSAVALLLLLCSCCFANANPNYIYFSDGNTTQGWQWVLGDTANWWIPIEGREGKTKTGKLSIKPANYKAKGDAVTLRWNRKKLWASASISGRTTDLSQLKNKAELVIVAKVSKKIRANVKLAMDCGKGCRGEVPIKEMLNNAEPNTWFVLPIPLNCFVYAGAGQMEAIGTPLSIGTDGRMELSIARVHVQALAKGDKGCLPAPLSP